MSRNRSGSVLSRHSYGGSNLSLSSIGSSGSGAPHAAPLEGVKKKKSNLLSADFKEAVNNKTKIEGIAISSRVKNKKGKETCFLMSDCLPICLSVLLSFCHSIFLSFCLMSLRRSVCVSFYPSVHQMSLNTSCIYETMQQTAL